MGRIKADIALESWLFGFWPCLGPGQFTLLFIFFLKRQSTQSALLKEAHIAAMVNE